MDGDPQEELAQLLISVAGGDRDAFARIYTVASPTMYAIARRLLNRTDLAEDVLQEAFLQVWRNAGRYRPDKGAPIAWLIGIVRFRALDRLRREPRENPLHDDEGVEDWANSGTSSGIELGFSDLDRLKRCLDELDNRHRDCILMAYYEGYTHSELASRFETPLGTVKSWIHRGLTSVRNCMGQ